MQKRNTPKKETALVSLTSEQPTRNGTQSNENANENVSSQKDCENIQSPAKLFKAADVSANSAKSKTEATKAILPTTSKNEDKSVDSVQSTSQTLKPVQTFSFDIESGTIKANVPKSTQRKTVKVESIRQSERLNSRTNISSVRPSAMQPNTNQVTNKSRTTQAKIPHFRMDKENAFSISFPRDLRVILKRDEHFINVENKLYKIPSLTVADVVSTYLTKEQSMREMEVDKGLLFREVFSGVKEYFDFLLGTKLLYQPEREQYSQIITNYPAKRMSDLYTPIHMLRLFVKLNTLLPFSQRDKTSMQRSLNYINEFLVYLSQNKSSFFDFYKLM